MKAKNIPKLSTHRSQVYLFFLVVEWLIASGTTERQRNDSRFLFYPFLTLLAFILPSSFWVEWKKKDFLRMKEEVQRRGQLISLSETRIFSICCTVRTAFTHSLRHYGHGLIPERNSRTGTQSVLDYPLSPFLYRPEKLTFFLQSQIGRASCRERV